MLARLDHAIGVEQVGESVQVDLHVRDVHLVLGLLVLGRRLVRVRVRVSYSS